MPARRGRGAGPTPPVTRVRRGPDATPRLRHQDRRALLQAFLGPPKPSRGPLNPFLNKQHRFLPQLVAPPPSQVSALPPFVPALHTVSALSTRHPRPYPFPLFYPTRRSTCERRTRSSSMPAPGPWTRSRPRAMSRGPASGRGCHVGASIPFRTAPLVSCSARLTRPGAGSHCGSDSCLGAQAGGRLPAGGGPALPLGHPFRSSFRDCWPGSASPARCSRLQSSSLSPTPEPLPTAR